MPIRWLRVLLLTAAVVVAALTARDYVSSRRTQAEHSSPEPDVIEPELNSRSRGWSWQQATADEARLIVTAGDFRQNKQSQAIELTDVELRIYRETEATFDRVVTDKALFDLEENAFRSAAPTTITLGEPLEGEPERKLTTIHTTDVVFNTLSGQATTDAEALYEFDGGRGRSRGALYDSAHRYFEMTSEAYVERFGNSPGAAVAIVRAGRLQYHERDERVDLFDGAELERGRQTIRAAKATIGLDEGRLRKVDAWEAVGEEQDPARTVRFTTPWLEVFYDDLERIEHIVGSGPSELTSEMSSSTTRASGARIDLHYAPDPDDPEESLLREAHLREDAQLVSLPRDAPQREVRAAWMKLRMGPEGREARRLETVGRGDLTIGAGAEAKHISADRLVATYGPGSRLERLEGTGAVELTRPAAGGQPPLETWSEGLEASFEPDSGELSELRQWQKFRFRQGQRHGSGNEASFEPATETLYLAGRARVEDPEAVLTATEIWLDQQAEQLRAAGQATTVFEQSPDETLAEGVFASGKPLFGAAQRFVSDEASGDLRYEGEARLWQEQNRVEAGLITVARAKRVLIAEGAVHTVLEDESSSSGESRVDVRSGGLRYEEPLRLAHFSEQVELTRGELLVKAVELDATLTPGEAGESGRLERAHALGSVEIIERARGRKGFGDEALYEPQEERLTIEGAPATAVNAEGEQSRGARLTYQIGDDRLLVQGGTDRAYTRRRER